MVCEAFDTRFERPCIKLSKAKTSKVHVFKEKIRETCKKPPREKIHTEHSFNFNHILFLFAFFLFSKSKKGKKVAAAAKMK